MRTATLSMNRNGVNATPAGEFATLGAHGPDTSPAVSKPNPTSFLGSLEQNIATKYKHGM